MGQSTEQEGYMIASERETTVTYTDADEAVQVYTCIRRDITALKKKLSRGCGAVGGGHTPGWHNLRQVQGSHEIVASWKRRKAHCF